MSFPVYYPYKSREAKERMFLTSLDRTFVRMSGPFGAPPLVLLPGMSAHSLLWAPNIAALSDVYRTYAVDRIGDVGRSESTRPVRCLDDFMDWLDELFRALELGDAINLVGLSYGGWLAAQCALRFPERIHKLILLAPGGVLPPAIGFMLRGSLLLTRNRGLARSVLNWLFEDLARKDPARVEASLDRMLMGSAMPCNAATASGEHFFR
jgi:pimeloyl-ACP methyl ester carboxylesterase